MGAQILGRKFFQSDDIDYALIHQACPLIKSPNFRYMGAFLRAFTRPVHAHLTAGLLGRILIDGDYASDGTQKCMTIDNASNQHGPWYAKAEPCTSDTKPSIAQTFGYGNYEDGYIYYWVC